MSSVTPAPAAGSLPGAPALPPAALPGQRLAEVDTPALVLDLDAFERNLDRLQAAADAAGVKLRPHGKAHKTPAVALAQIARGAVGICCQKVSEALPFIAAGVADIHISNEIATPRKAALLAQAARHARMSVCVDAAEQVALLAQAAGDAEVRLGVFVEIDIGHGRCGVQGAPAALALVRAIEAAAPALEFRGLQAYHGTLQHLRSHAERRAQSQRAAARAAEVVAALAAAGVACPVVTGGGSGSAEFDFASGVFTEVQAGSYAFMDRDYGDNEYAGTLRFDHALFLACTVMSTAAGGHAVVDAGLKSTTVESGLPAVWQAPGLHYRQASDEHGVVQAQAGAELPALGRQLLLVPGHCDPTLNLHDEIVCLRGGRVEALWPVAARGLSR